MTLGDRITLARPARRLPIGLALCLAWLLAGPGAQAGDTQAGDCEAAAGRAERQFGIPSGLLAAIGVVESGRTGATGRRTAWPWSVQAEATGLLLPSAADAARWVEQRRLEGVRSIDVGCFQVNLMHHPGAFASLAQAFDPDANAAAAATFLVALHGRLGGWEAAVGAYHSSSPDRGPPYMRRVYATWQQTPARWASNLAAVPAAMLMPAPSDMQPRILHLIAGRVTSTGTAGPPGVRMPRIFRGGMLGPDGRLLPREG